MRWMIIDNSSFVLMFLPPEAISGACVVLTGLLLSRGHFIGWSLFMYSVCFYTNSDVLLLICRCYTCLVVIPGIFL